MIDETTGKKQYRRVHWGTLADGNRFAPNVQFLLLDPAEREKFVFPDDWDLSELTRLPSHRGSGRPKYVEVDRDRLYGDVWLMEQVAEKLGLVKDLGDVRREQRKGPECTAAGHVRVSDAAGLQQPHGDWQEVTRLPTAHGLTLPTISAMTQPIAEHGRMELFCCRRARLGKREG